MVLSDLMVWWPIVKRTSVAQKLTKIQLLAYGVIGAMTTPTFALEVLSGLTDLTMWIRKEATAGGAL